MPATKKRPEPQDPPQPVYRAIRSVMLEYDKEVTAELPVPCEFLGIHAQVEGGTDDEGKALRKYARTVEPHLYYLFEAHKPTEEVVILALRGKADLPLDEHKVYTFLGSTIDRNPRHSGFASAWLVTRR